MKSPQIATSWAWSSYWVLSLAVCFPALAEEVSLTQQMHEAAKQGDLIAMQALLKEDTELLDAGDRRDRTPLYTAIESGQTQAAKFLIEKGANLEADDFSKGRPLQFAIEKNRRDIVWAMLQKGANPNTVGRTKDSAPILMAGGDIELVGWLLDHGANIEGGSRSGTTPLIAAAATGNLRMVVFLLGRGAAIDAAANNRETALDAAIRSAHLATARQLLQDGAAAGKTLGVPLLTLEQLQNQQVLEKRLQFAIEAHQQFTTACRNGQLEKVVKYLAMFPHLAKVHHWRDGPLDNAVRHNHLQIIPLLMQHGAVCDHDTLERVVKHGNTKMLGVLIDNGVDVNSKDSFGETLLHTAVETKRPAVIDLLLHKGASPNFLGDRYSIQGQTPLALAVSQGDLKLVKKFAQHNAQRNGSSLPILLKEAVSSGSVEMVKYFIQRKPSESLLQAAIRTASSARREDLVELLAAANPKLARDPYSLMLLERWDELEAVLKKDAQLLKAPVRNFGTLLHAAVGRRSPEAIRRLCQLGADPNARDRHGWTALHAAATYGALECVKALLENNADPNVRGASGGAALDTIDPQLNRHFHIQALRADEKAYESIRNLLRQHGGKSYLRVAANEVRSGNTRGAKHTAGFRVHNVTLYPGASWRISNEKMTVHVRNIGGEKWLEATLQKDKQPVKVLRNPESENRYVVTRTTQDGEKQTHYKTTNDFRQAHPELLKQFEQIEKEVDRGRLEGTWVLSGESVIIED